MSAIPQAAKKIPINSRRHAAAEPRIRARGFCVRQDNFLRQIASWYAPGQNAVASRMDLVSQHTFGRVDHEIFSSLWRWARRRHPNKNTRWCKQKYFAPRRGHSWSFFGETWDDEGQPSQAWLRHARSTPIKRHVKVQGDANPYDPAYETYFD